MKDGAKWRVGSGFSIGEIKSLGLNVYQARLLGIYVDKRRKSTWPQNVENLKKWLADVLEGRAPLPLPTLPKVVKVKPKSGRAFRGVTTAGRKSRGLLSTSYRETHNYKYRKKERERKLRKRHEATRGISNILKFST